MESDEAKNPYYFNIEDIDEYCRAVAKEIPTNPIEKARKKVSSNPNRNSFPISNDGLFAVQYRDIGLMWVPGLNAFYPPDNKDGFSGLDFLNKKDTELINEHGGFIYNDFHECITAGDIAERNFSAYNLEIYRLISK